MSEFVKIKLPSKGLTYEGYDPEKVMIRSMTGNDEKLIAELNQDNFDRKLNIFLKSVFKGVETEKLTSGDRGYLILWQVVNSYSKDKLFEGICPRCEQKVSFMVDLSKLDDATLPDGFKVPYPVVLSNDIVVYLKLFNSADEMQLSDLEKMFGWNWLHRWALTVVDDSKTFEEKVKFIGELPSRDLAKIRAFQEKFFHGPIMEWNYSCKHCGGAGRMAIPFQREWLFPSGKALTADFGAEL